MSDPQQPQVPPYASQPASPPHQHPQAHAQPVYAHAAQQGYAQQGYAQPTYPAPVSASPTGSNAMGKIGLILGLVSVGLQLLLNVIIQIMIRSDAYRFISIFSSVFSVIIFLAAVGALIFGIIGIKRVGAPHALAGIATGLGIAIVVSSGFSFILNATSMFSF